MSVAMSTVSTLGSRERTADTLTLPPVSLLSHSETPTLDHQFQSLGPDYVPFQMNTPDAILLVHQALDLLHSGENTRGKLLMGAPDQNKTWKRWESLATEYMNKWWAGEGKTPAHP